MDKETFRLMVTPTGRLLAEITRRYGETARWAELRKEYGSKIYQQLYPLALNGLVVIQGEGRGKQVTVTDKGKRIVECITKCFNDT